jgi:hypothetical protein
MIWVLDDTANLAAFIFQAERRLRAAYSLGLYNVYDSGFRRSSFEFQAFIV